MERIVLFRFHAYPAVCRNRLQLLRLFNPGISIFGLYGGPDRGLPRFRRALGDDLEHLFAIPDRPGDWKWRHSDLALSLWYREFGHRLSFDTLHLIEWDMLLLDSLAGIYRGIDPRGLGLSRLVAIKEVEQKWWWACRSPWREELKELLALVRRDYGYDQEPFSCIAGGACFPREFIERYSRLEIPPLVNDEARLPLFAQILGFPLGDTGFYSHLPSANHQFFNLKKTIPTARIRRELGKSDGWRVFHPYYRVFDRLVEGGGSFNLRHDFRTAAKRIMKFVLGRG